MHITVKQFIVLLYEQCHGICTASVNVQFVQYLTNAWIVLYLLSRYTNETVTNFALQLITVQFKAIDLPCRFYYLDVYNGYKRVRKISMHHSMQMPYPLRFNANSERAVNLPLS